MLYTSNYILDETLTLLKDRCGPAIAISLRQDLEASPSVKILWVDRENEAKAWKIFRSHKDKTYSFTDCTCFALMEEHAIKSAFAFDRHFRQRGFDKLP